jgi:hypothetical protein
VSETLANQPSTTFDLRGCRCPRCGYDLNALTMLQCPECGEAFTFERVDWRRSRARFARRSTVIVPLTLVALMAWLTATAHWLSGAVDRGRAGYAYSTIIALLTVAAGAWASRGYPIGERWLRLQMWCRAMVWLLLPALASMKLIDALVYFSWMTARHAEALYAAVLVAAAAFWLWHWRTMERKLSLSAALPFRMVAAAVLILLLHGVYGYRIADMFFTQFRGSPLLP